MPIRAWTTLQRDVMRLVGARLTAIAATRSTRSSRLAHERAGLAAAASIETRRAGRRAVPDRAVVLLRGAESRAAAISCECAVLLLATTTGYQTRAFGEAAERLGVRLVFATDRCDRLDDPWRDGAIPIRFHDKPSSVEAVVASCRGRAATTDSTACSPSAIGRR